jgi:hypothetical protein
LNRIKDGWVIAFLIVLSAGIAYWASVQVPDCQREEAHSLWDAMPWTLKVGLGQLAVAGGLMLWTLSRRFITPVPFVAEETRTRGEFLHSMAQLWHRAGASQLAIDQLGQGFRRAIGSKLGLPATSDSATLVQAAKHRWPDQAEKLTSLLNNLDNGQAQASDSVLRDLAHRMARFRKEIER